MTRSAALGLLLVLVEASAEPAHLGVASCASSSCHGSARELAATPVLQNEYVTWSRHDPHANAWRVLREPAATKMARRLGLGEASSAPACLACHAEAAPARGPRFQADDGVGCEACHGAASGWLARHDDGDPAARADSQAAGLRALHQPAVLADTCTGCHAGGKAQLATHAMMAAGHPRLSFDLDTFSELWRTSGGRQHYRVDADYRQRNGPPATVARWLRGLAVGGLAQVSVLAAGGPRGLIPEFAAFDCYSCHRDMGIGEPGRPGAARQTSEAVGLAPGSLRLNDSMLRLLVLVGGSSEPVAARSLGQALDRLQSLAVQGGGPLPTALDEVERRVEALLTGLIPRAGDVVTARRMLDAIGAAARRGAFADYARAEQAAMGSVALLSATATGRDRVPATEALFATLADETRFDRDRFNRMLSRLSRGTSP
jgi:hypothetical protein